MRNKITIICLAILIIASIISYLPYIYAAEGVYGRLHMIILFATVTLFCISNHYKKLITHRYMNKILMPMLVFCIFVLLFYGIGLRATTSDILQIGIVYVSIWIGYMLNLKPNTVIGLILLYGIVAIYLGSSAITTYLSAFSMDENMYEIDAKNQIGAIVSLASFFVLHVAQTSANKKTYILSYVIFAILFILLIYIRCRTALLAMMIVGIILIYKVNNTRKLSIYALIGICLAIFFSDQIYDILQNAFIGDRSSANLDDLSSNRLERNEQALTYLGEHLFIGEMKSHSGIEIIHNYILNRLVRYGLWAMPLLVIYFVIVIKAIRHTLLSKKFSLYDIGYFAILIPFICSMLEPDAPFGPGSVYSFTYIMFGYSLKNSLNNRTNS